MTVSEYLTDHLHLSPERADAHLRSSFVRVYTGRGYETVTDGARELVAGEKVVLQSAAATEEVRR